MTNELKKDIFDKYPNMIDQNIYSISNTLYDNIIQLETNYQYLYSDFENHKRRTNIERDNLITNTSIDVMSELLPIIDSLELSLSYISEDSDDKPGIDSILSMIKNILVKYNAVETDSLYKKFDPEFHNALNIIDCDKDMSGKIITVVKKGYVINGNVLRHAMVIVGK